MIYATITEDHLGLDDVLPDWKPYVGPVLDDGTRPIGDELLNVRLLDDDRELYYEAEATDDALEPLLAWAMHDAGATILQVKKDGKWEDVIS